MGPSWRRKLRYAGRGLLWAALAVPLVPAFVIAWPRRWFVLDLAAHASHWFIYFGLLVAIILFATRRWRHAAVAGAGTMISLIVFASVVKPTRLPEPVPLPGSQRLRIVAFNAYATSVSNHDPFLRWALAQDPHLIAIVDGPLFPATCNQLLRDRGYRLATIWRRGNAPLWSRLPVRVFGEYWTGATMSPGGVNPFLVEMPDGQQVAICSIHLSSPRRPSSWQWDLEMAGFHWPLLRRLHGYAQIPLVLIGDFNTTRAGRLYRELYAQCGLTDAETSFLPGSTWPSYLPGPLGFGIDHCWVSPGIAVTKYEIGPSVLSDHRPLFVELAIPPDLSRVERPTKLAPIPTPSTAPAPPSTRPLK